MAKKIPCQRLDCDEPGKPRAMTDPASGEPLELILCDEDYADVLAKEEPPRWFNELLNHIGLVG
jgi:hypothetical protein